MAPADLEQYLSPQMKSGHLSQPEFKLIPSTPPGAWSWFSCGREPTDAEVGTGELLHLCKSM